MTDEFLTKGLQDDRYLKAIRLVEQFDDEIESRLRQFDQRMVEQQPGLFEADSGPSIRTNRTPSNGLAFHRINHSMTGPQAPDNQNQRLNVHLYWMPPTEYDRTDLDGALRGFGYKIKGADPSTDEDVAKRTRENWNINTASNPYDPNTVFYRHVSSAGEVEDTADILIDHFAQFGSKYASD